MHHKAVLFAIIFFLHISKNVKIDLLLAVTFLFILSMIEVKWTNYYCNIILPNIILSIYY